MRVPQKGVNDQLDRLLDVKSSSNEEAIEL
jgi:hypothetical protein